MLHNRFVIDFKTVPMIGIIRGINRVDLFPVLSSVIEAGMTCVEITMNTQDAPALIKNAVIKFGTDILIGAGTVINSADLHLALNAGAKFIVAPNFNLEVAKGCCEKNIPYVPGALTPTEIINAWSYGAAMVKIFPVSVLGGASYIKELRGPLSDVSLLACSGVTLENAQDYFAAGANAIAIGSQIFRPDWLKSKDYSSIKKSAAFFVQAAKVKEI